MAMCWLFMTLPQVWKQALTLSFHSQSWGAANPNQFHIISVIQSLDPNCTLDSFLCNLVILSWSDRLKVPMTSIQEKSAVITMLIVAQDPDTQNGKP